MNELLPSSFFSRADRVDTTEVFTELLYRIRKVRYELSEAEAKALKTCENDLQVRAPPIPQPPPPPPNPTLAVFRPPCPHFGLIMLSCMIPVVYLKRTSVMIHRCAFSPPDTSRGRRPTGAYVARFVIAFFRNHIFYIFLPPLPLPFFLFMNMNPIYSSLERDSGALFLSKLPYGTRRCTPNDASHRSTHATFTPHPKANDKPPTSNLANN